MPRRIETGSALNLVLKNAFDEPGPFRTDVVAAPK
jgi:hypothetical protein